MGVDGSKSDHWEGCDWFHALRGVWSGEKMVVTMDDNRELINDRLWSHEIREVF